MAEAYYFRFWTYRKHLKKTEDGNLTASPTIPEEWDYFKLENLHVCGDTYTVFYDKTGEKYRKGCSLHLYKNGEAKNSVS